MGKQEISTQVSKTSQFRTFSKAILPNRIKRLLRAVAFGVLDLRWELASGVLIRIRTLSDWAVYNEVFVAGDYDAAILMAIETAKLKGEFHVVDVGANVGFFTLRCADLIRRRGLQTLHLHITAIEGNPNTYNILRHQLANQISMAEFKAVNGLVGQRVGSGAISDLEHSGLNRLVSNELDRRCLVSYVDVEEIVGPGNIGLLKCDIEGSELAFLENYPELLKRTSVVVLELHTQECDEARCLSLLNDAGLTVQQNLAKGALTKVIMASRLSS